MPPIPLELLAFGLAGDAARLGAAELRDVPLSPDGGVIADYHGPVDDPAALAARLAGTPGVIDHGLFEADARHATSSIDARSTRSKAAGGSC